MRETRRGHVDEIAIDQNHRVAGALEIAVRRTESETRIAREARESNRNGILQI